jgi:exodeoxyribonuclease VII large subunit
VRLTRAAARYLEGSEARLRALDPRRVLERGYSITRDERGRVVKSVEGVAPDDVVHTELADGGIASRVETLVRGDGASEEDRA